MTSPGNISLVPVDGMTEALAYMRTYPEKGPGVIARLPV
jgi:hypothetical protein